MEIDSCKHSKKINQENSTEEGEQYDLNANGWNVFSSIWIRRNLCHSNEYDRVLLDYNRIILYYFGPIFWVIFLLKEFL